MLPSLHRRRLIAAGISSAAVIAIMAGTLPAEARRACTNAEMRRISESFIIDCFKKPGARVSCQSNGDPVCCYNTPWGSKCTTNPGGSPATLDPGPGPTRPPRAGMPNPPPDRVGPYTPVPPRMGGNPDRVAPTPPVRPPRMDPGPGRIGPSGPTGGASIPRSSGGKR